MTGTLHSAHSFGGPIPYPIKGGLPGKAEGQTEQTKTFMSSYFMPLWAFGLNFEDEFIKYLTIDMIGNASDPFAKGVFYLDTLALVKD